MGSSEDHRLERQAPARVQAGQHGLDRVIEPPQKAGMQSSDWANICGRLHSIAQGATDGEKQHYLEP